MKKDTYFEGLSSFTLCWIFPLCFFSSEWEKHCRFIYTSLYTFAHLDLQAVVDSCRPQETESRRRVLSTADKTESSLCVSVLSVFSQVTNPLSDSLLCWGYPPKYACSCISEWPVFHSECHYKMFSFNAMKNVWQIFGDTCRYRFTSFYATASYSISVLH